MKCMVRFIFRTVAVGRFTLCILVNSYKMHILVNSEDPDEMPHNKAFHQGIHCLLR